MLLQFYSILIEVCEFALTKSCESWFNCADGSSSANRSRKLFLLRTHKKRILITEDASDIEEPKEMAAAKKAAKKTTVKKSTKTKKAAKKK